MATPRRDPIRLRLTNRSVLIAIGMFGLTLLLIRIVAASTRVLGWLAVAIVVASLLHPLVERLKRRVPAGLALAVVVLSAMASTGLMVYLGVEEVREQASRLQDEAPAAAGEIEESSAFAREFELRTKVESFVDELPDRLRGGTPAEALRANATRGVAFLATTVLTIFLMLHGPRLIESGLSQMGDEDRRNRLRGVLGRAYGRYGAHVGYTLARGLVAGAFGWVVSAVVGLPGPVLLGMIVGVASVVPLFGVVVGAVPILLFTAAIDTGRLVLVLALVLAYQAVEATLVQPILERRSVHVGPVLTLLAAMAGLELYGLGGMIVAVVGVVFVAAIGKELAPSEESDLLAAADALLPLDDPTGTSVLRLADDEGLHTRKGDDGTTGLLYGGRVRKDSPAPTAYGDVDEAQAVLGVARAETDRDSELDLVLVGLARDLWVLMAELATDPANRHKLVPESSLVTAAMVTAVEHRIDDIAARFELPKEFVVPGQTRLAAVLDLGRTVVRRAERHALAAAAADSHVVAYLNRLSDLLWTLARWQEGESLRTRTP